MNKLYVFILMAAIVVAIDGCGKKEERAKEPSVEKTTVPEEKPGAAPESEIESKPKEQLLAGEIGSSPRWGSGWLDLATVTDFAKDDVLRLQIGGTASKVLVRLLPEGKFPDSSVGIIGGAVTVPENRIVEVVLDNDRKNIIQISVHGGPNPWGIFPLGGGNGPATLESATLVR